MNTLIQVAYLVAAVLFIVGLKQLSSPKGARNGNLIAAVGMVIALGATIEAVRETIGWKIAVAPEVAATPPPTEAELRLIREELDPGGVYTK